MSRSSLSELEQAAMRTLASERRRLVWAFTTLVGGWYGLMVVLANFSSAFDRDVAGVPLGYLALLGQFAVAIAAVLAYRSGMRRAEASFAQSVRRDRTPAPRQEALS